MSAHEIIINETNYSLVTQVFKGYKVNFSLGYPERGNDGGLVLKIKQAEKSIPSNTGVQQEFSDFREVFGAEFIKKDLIYIKFSYLPLYEYIVRCPECGGSAFILDGVILAKGVFPIACPDCPGAIKEEITTWNNVGACLFLDQTNEEKSFMMQRKWCFGKIPFKNYKKFLEVVEN